MFKVYFACRFHFVFNVKLFVSASFLKKYDFEALTSLELSTGDGY